MASMDVYAICDAVEKAFGFLTQYGYSFFWASDLPIFLFKGEADDVQIAVNTYEGQVDCELLYSGEKIRFTRISEKAGLSGLRFSWQFHDFDSLEKGLPVLAESLQELIRAYDYSKEENVEALYEEAKNARDPATVQMGVDVRQADTFWQSHDYQKVRNLLKKWEGSLPEREEKRLKFAEGKAGTDSGESEMTNEMRAEALAGELGFDFEKIDKKRIIDLIEKELADFQEGSSEYIRLLCGYLFCLGDRSNIDLLKKVKYGINFDVGCMIDQEWIDSLENGGVRDERTRSRDELIADFVQYYSGTASLR